MSRALTAWSHKQKYSPERMEQIERLMADRGVSEPVARNLLKFATLGIGPLVEEGVADRYVGTVRPKSVMSSESAAKKSSRRAPDPDRDRDLGATDFQAAKRAKMRQQEALLRAQEEAREQELAEEERLRRERLQQKAKRGVPGISKLGPVLAREEKVDPLPPKLTIAGISPFPADIEDLAEDVPEPPVELDAAQANATARPKRSGKPEEASRRKVKKKKKRRRGAEVSDSGSDQDAGGRGSKSRSAGRGKGRSRSRSGGEDRQNKDGLMSEAEVIRRMNMEEKSARGSMRAKSRIQKEMEAWEAAKRSNKEYWKPPKHCLCFAPETAKKREEPRR